MIVKEVRVNTVLVSMIACVQSMAIPQQLGVWVLVVHPEVLTDVVYFRLGCAVALTVLEHNLVLNRDIGAAVLILKF